MALTIDWTRQPGGLVRMSGTLHEAKHRTEPVQDDEHRVFVSVPLGYRFVLEFDSHAVVQVEYADEAVTIQLHDDLTVVLRVD